MSPPDGNDHPPSAREDAQSVLANLPRARPQRSTPRRAAARKARASAAAAQVESAAAPERPAARSARSTAQAAPRGARQGKPKTVRSSAAKPRAAAGAKRSRGGARGEPVPRQGFASEGDATQGSVQPPGATELVTSALEIVGEFAKSGVSTGERLLKDVLSGLSPS
jgi:hypothetical protein